MGKFLLSLVLIGNLSWAQEITPDRTLASTNVDEDIAHYHSMKRRMGLDLGYLHPMQDFGVDFNPAPVMGIHYTWEAIEPFGITLGMLHGASSYRAGISSGKLTITEISVLAQASHKFNRVVAYAKLGASFLFNHVSFSAARIVTAGNDTNLTTLGILAGVGLDFIIAREVSLGIDATLHYAVPKHIDTTAGTFNLGSPFMTFGVRLNF